MLRGQIRVNCVALGAVQTELLNTWSAAGLPEGGGPEASEKKLQDMLSLFKSKTLTGTVGQPEDVAEAYLWLMRDRFVTGTCVHSDGGYLLA
jgi:NAD(P)-dependent dehydrogenase (short-subunit alcohol dehydrogenase family)